jgi:hypothetical protein
MNSEYIWIGNKHINSFGSASQFWADYYYRMYREGTKMFYQLKAVMTYKHTGGAGGYYNDPVVAIFKMNYDGSPAYEATKAIKPANNGMMYNGYTYTAESDWFSLDKTNGSTNCFININNANTWGFDSPDYYFTLGIIPALSTITLNDGVYFDVDKEENVPNIIPAVLTKYDNSYSTKLKISLKNNSNETTLIRDYQDFNSNEFSFTTEELTKIYNATPNWKMFFLMLELETFTSNGVSLGVYTDTQPAKISDTDLKPTFNGFTYSDNNPDTYELTKNRGTLIKGYSNPRITVAGINEAIAHKGASITKYTFINGSQSLDYNMGTYPAYRDLTKVSERTLVVWAVDSRGESTKAEKLATNWIDYTKIEKTSFNIERDNGGTSNIVTLKLKGKMFDGRFGLEEDNAVENGIKNAIYKYKKTDSDEWIDGTTELNVVKNGNSYSLEQQIRGDLGAEGFDQEESYDIYIEVSDQLSTISDTITLGAGSPAQAIYKNNIALGRPYDEYAGGKVQGIYEVGDLFLTLNKECDPAKRFGGTWELIAKGKTLVGVDENDTDFNKVGKTGGSKFLQEHTHLLDIAAGSGGSVPAGYAVQYNANGSYPVNGLDHKTSGEFVNWGIQKTGTGNSQNLQPYLTCYIWQRIS